MVTRILFPTEELVYGNPFFFDQRDVRDEHLLAVRSKCPLIGHAVWEFSKGFERLDLNRFGVGMKGVKGNKKRFGIINGIS